MAVTCPQCGAQAAPEERFCETCGADLTGAAATAVGAPTPTQPAAPAGPAAPDGGVAHEGTLLDDASRDATDRSRRSPIRITDADLTVLPPTCASCSGKVAPDGYCEQCGAAAPRLRDHWLDQPAPWLAAVCDRGVRHTRNEDAMAVAATTEPGRLGVLVVCDGVSMAPDSDIASLAASRAARDTMVSGLRLREPSGAASAPGAVRTGTAQQTARAGELTKRMIDAGAAAQAQAAAAGAGVPEGKSPPSCTFVAAILERGGDDGPGVLVAGWVGDSRAYWLPDGGPAVQVSHDDSWAAEAIAQGVPRAEAERMPQAHAITRWLGSDAPDPVPQTTVMALDRPGWVLVCSDGLWNYCSDPVDLSALVVRTITGLRGETADPAMDPMAGPAAPDRAVDPAPLAEALTTWAIEQGGHDNITVALARFDPVTAAVEPVEQGAETPETPEGAGV